MAHSWYAIRRRLLLAGVALLLLQNMLIASDHADPIDLTRWKPLEPVITDLFVFPVDQDGKSIRRFERTDDVSLKTPGVEKRQELTKEEKEREQIKSLIVIVCVRRALTKTDSLNLEPYHYLIHMDTRSPVSFDDTPPDRAQKNREVQAGGGYQPLFDAKVKRPTGQEARARYGGSVEKPEKISDDILIQITLKNDATLDKMSVIRGLKDAAPDRIIVGQRAPDEISIWTGVRDDPFIFPAFFKTNVVAMVLSIPLDRFEATPETLLVWATSHKGEDQIDHVGRSLRTQNPRFDLLNTLPPSEHVAALQAAHENPNLMRDLFLRFNLNQLVAFREWDFVPDVMIYSPRFEVGFPNGRLLEDDVAALLAQHGDTLLLELSHSNAQWPRRTANDKEFSSEFPYLAAPWPDREPPKPYQLTTRTRLILIAIGVFVLLILFLAAWKFLQIVRWLLGFKPRPTYQ